MTFIDSLSYGLMLVFFVLAIYLTVSLIRTDRQRKRDARRYNPVRDVVNSADFPGATPDERLRAALEWAQMQPSPSPMVRVEKGASRYFDGLRSVNGVRLIGGQS